MDTGEFLLRHGLAPALIDPALESERMREHMASALNGRVIDIPMIPTYLRPGGVMTADSPVIVIDAGGTHFRRALAEYDGRAFRLSGLYKTAMPGTGKPAAWQKFISFTADTLMPLLDKADRIGFCFSYNTAITPELDARVSVLDKEVVLTGCEGQYLWQSLLRELEKRGVRGKRCVVLNDTAAALLGNPAAGDRERYSDAVGMICGTGVNTCAVYEGMLYNLESGAYAAMPRGDFDECIDRASSRPGEKLMEKMCSGAYIGRLAGLALGLDRALDGAEVDRLTDGADSFAREVCLAILERSARCMAANLLAIMKLTGKGLDKPVCVCAEGSLIEKNSRYRAMLRAALEAYSGPYRAEIVTGHDSTLAGSAAAALLQG